MNELAAIRAHRAEVEALLAYRHASGPVRAAAWWRLQQARRARIAILPPEYLHALPALPPPPPEALSRTQQIRLRLGWLRPESARPPSRLRRALPPG
ncbi:MAG TPA: hypothetical protein VE033_11815 [Acetobacteraceae bacterium]|nr:hypothetical protein [Acetobacteraceae bacterium]